MATPTDTNRNLLTVIARMHAKPGKEQELREALEGAHRADQQGEGLRQLRPAPGRRGPGWFFFYENWDSAEDLDAHLTAPHLVEFAGRLDELLDERGAGHRAGAPIA